MTFDHVLDGSSRHGASGRRWPALGHVYLMRYPGVATTQTAVEALVAWVTTTAVAAVAATAAVQGKEEGPQQPPGQRKQRRLWKIVRTFDPSAAHASSRSLAGRAAAGSEDYDAADAQAAPRREEQPEDEHLCLFDLEADPAERCNLAGAGGCGGVLRELRRRLARARVRHGGPPLDADDEGGRQLRK